MPAQSYLPWVVARADRREPQLLQRPHRSCFSLRHPARSPPCSSIASRRGRRGAARSGIAAIPIRHAADAIHQFELCHADPPGVRHDGVPACARRLICRARATRARRTSTSRCSIRPGAMVYGPVARCVLRTATKLNRLQFLTDPQLSHAGLRHADPAAAGGGRMALMHRPRQHRRSQMLLVLAIAPLVLGITRKVKARLLRRDRAAALAALSSTSGS